MNTPASRPEPDRDEIETPEHAAWLREAIESALKAKAEGKLTYTPLNALAAKYGFNAR